MHRRVYAHHQGIGPVIQPNLRIKFVSVGQVIIGTGPHACMEQGSVRREHVLQDMFAGRIRAGVRMGVVSVLPGKLVI